MAADGSIVIKIVGDDKELQDALRSSKTSVKKSLKAVTSVITEVTAVTTGALSALAGLGVTYNSQMEDYTASFKVMLGTAEAAYAKVDELKEMAAATPFGMAELADATQTLLAFQIPAEESMDILQMLGDVALGDKQKLSGLALVFGQVASAGRLQGQDLMQMINQGFNPLNYIAKRTGESMEELRDRMSKGAVSADEVTQAFKDATSEGGQFYKGMETASKTVSGLVSTLKDDAMSLIGEVVQPINDELRDNLLPTALDAVAEISEAFARGGLDEAVAAFGDVLADGVSLVADMAPDMLDAAMDLVSAFARGLWRNRGKIGKTLKKIVNELLDKLDDVAPVLKPVTSIVRKLTDDFDDLIPVVKLVVGTMVTFKAAMSIGAIISTTTKAVIAFNAAITANPVLLIVGALAVLAGTFVAAASDAKAAKDEMYKLSDSQQAVVDKTNDITEAYAKARDASQEKISAVETEYAHTSELADELFTLVDANGNVEDANRERVDFILGELNEAMGTEYKLTGNQIEQYTTLKDTIYEAIDAQKTRALLTAYEDEYVNAVQNVNEAERNRGSIAAEVFGIEETIAGKRNEILELESELKNSHSLMERLMIKNHISDIEDEIEAEETKKRELQQKYLENENTLKGYYSAISGYENASIAEKTGNYEDAIRLLTDEDYAWLKSKEFKALTLSQQQEEYEKYLDAIDEEMKTADAATLEELQKHKDELLAEYNKLIDGIAQAPTGDIGSALVKEYARRALEEKDTVVSAARELRTAFEDELDFSRRSVAGALKSGVGSSLKGKSGVNGSHAGGLDRVPYDGYIAELHKDEMVLPADLARRMRAAVDAEQTYTAAAASKTADVYALRRMLSPSPSNTTTNNYNHTSVFNSPKALSWREMRLYQESQRQQMELLGV